MSTLSSWRNFTTDFANVLVSSGAGVETLYKTIRAFDDHLRFLNSPYIATVDIAHNIVQ